MAKLTKEVLLKRFAAHEAKIAPSIAARHARVDARLEWYGDKVANNIKISMKGRVMLAAQLLRDKIVANISRPVYKYKKTLTKGPRAGQTATVVLPGSRSKPGEFPRAETSTLLRNITWQWESAEKDSPISQVLVPQQIQRPGLDSATVRTTLDYALALEFRMDRSFMLRTFKELEPALQNVLMGKPL